MIELMKRELSSIRYTASFNDHQGDRMGHDSQVYIL